MIDGKIYRKTDGTFVLGVAELTPLGSYHSTNTSMIPKSEVESYLAEHPEALIPEPLPPEPTPEDLAAQARQQRNNLLQLSDYTQLPDYPKDREKYVKYRQLLRDIPKQKGFPNKIDWPAEPE